MLSSKFSWFSFRTFATVSLSKVRRTGTGEKALRSKPSVRPKEKLGRQEYQFVDVLRAAVTAGTGGHGCVSFAPGRRGLKRGKPDGGNGGRGGDVVIRADVGTTSLHMESYHFVGNKGGNASGRRCHGKNGSSKIVNVPLGTVVRVRKETRVSETEIEENEWLEFFGKNPQKKPKNDKLWVIYDLLNDGDCVTVAKGGAGGVGNCENKTIDPKTKQRAIRGLEGQKAEIELELKCIADVGLVGFPNAGKSTFLTQVSDAHPKIAAYPFTTLHPNLGVARFAPRTDQKWRTDTLIFADIPGLVKGAHLNRGLGHAFLRHVERTKILLIIIDTLGTDGRDPVDDFVTLVEELDSYHQVSGSRLMDKPVVVLANKCDGDPKLFQENLKRLKKVCDLPIYQGSTLTGEGIEELVADLKQVKVSEQKRDKVRCFTLESRHLDPIDLPADRYDHILHFKDRKIKRALAFDFRGYSIASSVIVDTHQAEQSVEKLFDVDRMRHVSDTSIVGIVEPIFPGYSACIGTIGKKSFLAQIPLSKSKILRVFEEFDYGFSVSKSLSAEPDALVDVEIDSDEFDDEFDQEIPKPDSTEQLQAV